MFLRAFAFPRRTPLLLASAAALAASLAFFVAPPPAPALEPTPAVAVPMSQGGGETHSYAYYPEQLAALSSLSNFAPVADPGLPAAVAPVKEAPAARRPARPTETRRVEPRAAASPIAPSAAASPGAPLAAEPERHEEGWKVFGVAVPKPGWPDTKSLRDKAAGWGEAAAGLPGKALALGAGVTRLWRAPERVPQAPPEKNN